MKNKNVLVGIDKLNDDIIIPEYQTFGSSGLDIHSPIDFELYPGETKIIGTGFKLDIPHGYEIQIRPRSSLAIKHGIIIPSSPGTIDSDYEGELKVALRLIDNDVISYSVKKGDRVAQMILSKVEKLTFYTLEIEDVDPNSICDEEDNLHGKVRGEGGIGSTGK